LGLDVDREVLPAAERQVRAVDLHAEGNHRQIYDSKNGTGPDDFGALIERELRTYLALVHICGIKAQHEQPVPANLSGTPRSQSGLLPDHR
jgi:hypothetical protein